MDWKPIDTVPDPEHFEILVCNIHNGEMWSAMGMRCKFSGEIEWLTWDSHGDPQERIPTPTHWAELPNLPDDKQQSIKEKK